MTYFECKTEKKGTCTQHNWEFHAEMSDGTLIRWCNQCGGLQTYESPEEPGDPKRGLGLEYKGFTNVVAADVRLPEVSIDEAEGLYGEGLLREVQPDLRSFRKRGLRPNFDKPWSPDDDGRVVEDKPVEYVGVPRLDCYWIDCWSEDATIREYDEMTVLAGLKKDIYEDCGRECDGK